MKIKTILPITILLLWGTIKTQPPGLHNFGATCYLNATVQALYNCPAITNTLIAQDVAYEPDTLADLYVKLITAMHNQPSPNDLFDMKAPDLGVIKPDGKPLNNFVARAWQVMGDCGQMDATRFVTTLLNSLTNDGQDTQDIATLFNIGQASTIRCPLQTAQGVKFNFEKQRIDEETTLNVQAENLSTLKECLDSYFATEIFDDPQNYYRLDLSGQEMIDDPRLVHFNKTNIPNCSKQLALSHLGDFVIITLKRFALNQLGEYAKLDHNVTVPTLISFGDYMLDPNAQATPPTYELIGAIVHRGSLRGGHYIAYVKVGTQWYRCNDSFIQAISWENMVNTIDPIYAGFGIHKSYALVYKKLTLQEAQEREEQRKQEEERKQREEEERIRKQEEERKRKAEEERLRKEQAEKIAREKERLRKEAEKLAREKERLRKQTEALATQKFAQSLQGLTNALDVLTATLKGTT